MFTLRNPFLSAFALVGGLALLAIAADDTARRPAPSLTRPVSAEKAPDADGFMQRWLILEPIRANGLTDSAVQAAVKKEYSPASSASFPATATK